METIEYRHRGQSLIEILIAIAVTGVVLASVVALISVGLRVGRASRENAYAITLVRDMGTAVRGMAAIDWQTMWGSNGLVGYWGMDEGIDNRLYDPAFGNNGTAVNGPTWQTSANCRVGQCLSFNGSSHYVAIGTHPSFDVTQITVSAWVYSGTTTAELTSVSRYNNASPQNGNWILGHGSSASTYRFLVRIGGANYSAQSGTGFSTNAWNHLAGTYDGSYVRLYVNGVQIATSSLISESLSANTTAVRIGNRAGDTNYWNGRIDEVKIFGRALSAAEISRMYATPGGLYPENLGGFWTVNEGRQSFSTALGAFARWYTIEIVQRDGSNNIVSSGGTPDPATAKVTYNVLTPRGRTISTTEYVTRSESRVTVQTDWIGGPGATGPFTEPPNRFASSTGIDYSATGTIRMQGAQ